MQISSKSSNDVMIPNTSLDKDKYLRSSPLSLRLKEKRATQSSIKMRDSKDLEDNRKVKNSRKKKTEPPRQITLDKFGKTRAAKEIQGG
jgi:hypothetical protein